MEEPNIEEYEWGLSGDNMFAGMSYDDAMVYAKKYKEGECKDMGFRGYEDMVRKINSEYTICE